MSELKHLNLTERDFDLLVEGLDTLPEKGLAGELMGGLLEAMLTKDGDDPTKNKFAIERERRQKEKEQKNVTLKEDIKILQGKLLMLKRFLMQEGALSTTYEIINHIR